jgi:hypothetical protein
VKRRPAAPDAKHRGACRSCVYWRLGLALAVAALLVTWLLKLV